MEVGIGRIPVSTSQEAQTVVDKIINYAKHEDEYLGDWRSKICLIGDNISVAECWQNKQH